MVAPSQVGKGAERLGSEAPCTEQGFGGVALYLCGRLRRLELGDPRKVQGWVWVVSFSGVLVQNPGGRGLKPQHLKLSLVVCTCNPRTWAASTGESEVQDHSGLYS